MAGTRSISKLVPLLFLITPLAGCAAHAGFMPGFYDGEQLQTDEAAIKAYRENREIIRNEKGAYYPAAFPEYFTREPLPYAKKVPRGLAPHSENGEVWISGDSLKVGDKMPEGRYVIVPLPHQEGGNLLIREGGEVVFEEVLYSYAATTVEVDVYEGQSLNLVGGEWAIVFAHPDPALSLYQQNEDGYVFSSGIWHVGYHLPAGTYRLKELAAGFFGIPFLYIIAPDGSYRVHELAATAQADSPPDVTVALHEGEALYISQTNSLTLVPAE